MKLDRLASQTQTATPESVERAAVPAAEVRVRRVEAGAAIEGDRERSLQQELAGFNPGAVADFAGGEQVLQGAREVAAQLTALGAAADDLIKPVSTAIAHLGVDDRA